jgi:hypothetical protein
MPPCFGPGCCSVATFVDADKPLRFHAPKVGPHMPLERRSGIQHVRLPLLAHEHHPMPRGPPAFAMPLDRKKRTGRQCRPGPEGPWCRTGTQSVPLKQAPHMSGVRPEPIIRRDDTEATSRPPRRPVADTGQRCHTCNATAGRLELHHRRYARSARQFQSQISKLRCLKRAS